ncbi:formin-binding protein [Dispira parvispora]|uniref:Formin-binding protein n=1 Tax=Dispira parvispora TaxID=1520584 RepID=A0A9W8E973_9FUNG|nr:formin-binding protein [Dispira parvispora]
MATSTLPPETFATSFWGKSDRGVEVLMNRLRNSKQTCQELQSLFTARASIEEEFGKKLLKLARSSIGKNEIGTLKDSLVSIKNELEICGKAHIDLAHQIKVELENTMAVFINKQREKRKMQTSVIEKSSRNRSMIRSQLVRAKDRYDSEISKASGLEQALFSMQQSKDVDRLRGRLEKTQQSSRQADEDFKKTMIRLKDSQSRWECDWRDACHTFQSLEEERLDFLRTHLWSYTNVLSNVLVTEDESFERVRKGLEQFSVSQDIQLFIDRYGTGKEPHSAESNLPSIGTAADGTGPSSDAGNAQIAARSRSQSVLVQGTVPLKQPPVPTSFGHGAGVRRSSAPGNPEPPVPSHYDPRAASPVVMNGDGMTKSRPISVYHRGAHPNAPMNPSPPVPGAQPNGVGRASSTAPTSYSNAINHSPRHQVGSPSGSHSFADRDPNPHPREVVERNVYTSASMHPNQSGDRSVPYGHPRQDNGMVAGSGNSSPQVCPITKALNSVSPMLPSPGPNPLSQGHSNTSSRHYGSSTRESRRTNSPGATQSNPVGHSQSHGHSASPTMGNSRPITQARPNNHYSPQMAPQEVSAKPGPPSRRERAMTNPSPYRHPGTAPGDPNLNINTQHRAPFAQPSPVNIPTPTSSYNSSLSTPTTPTQGNPHGYGHPQHHSPHLAPAHPSPDRNHSGYPVSRPAGGRAPVSHSGSPSRATMYGGNFGGSPTPAQGNPHRYQPSPPATSHGELTVTNPSQPHSSSAAGNSSVSHNHHKASNPSRNTMYQPHSTGPPPSSTPAQHTASQHVGLPYPQAAGAIPPRSVSHSSQQYGNAHRSPSLNPQTAAARPDAEHYQGRPSGTHPMPNGSRPEEPRMAPSPSYHRGPSPGQAPPQQQQQQQQQQRGSPSQAAYQASPSPQQVQAPSNPTYQGQPPMNYSPSGTPVQRQTAMADTPNNPPQSGPPNQMEPSASNRPILFYVRALYDYAAESPEEISIKKGGLIAVIATHIDGWWEGEVKGDNQQVSCGMFPSNFTEPLSF